MVLALRKLMLPLIQRPCILQRQISAVHLLCPPSDRIFYLTRGYARMARRIPPVRPANYSESESEKEENEEEMEDKEKGGESDEWEGLMIDLGSGSDNDPIDGEQE